MKFSHILQTSLAPLVLMVYGWHLGQLHQSGYDMAGIFLFVTGLFGLALAISLFTLTRKFPWHNRWFMNVLTGAAGCGVGFALVLLFARLHG